MGYAYLTVYGETGSKILGYAEINWSGSSGSTTVYVNITGVEYAGNEWRIKKGSTVYLQGSGIGEKSFTGTIGQSYQLQILERETSTWGWQGGTFNLTPDSSGGGDSGGGDDDDDVYYIYYNTGTGTSLSVERTWNETTGEGSEGEIYSGTEIAWKDYF